MIIKATLKGDKGQRSPMKYDWEPLPVAEAATLSIAYFLKSPGAVYTATVESVTGEGNDIMLTLKDEDGLRYVAFFDEGKWSGAALVRRVQNATQPPIWKPAFDASGYHAQPAMRQTYLVVTLDQELTVTIYPAIGITEASAAATIKLRDGEQVIETKSLNSTFTTPLALRLTNPPRSGKVGSADLQ